MIHELRIEWARRRGGGGQWIAHNKYFVFYNGEQIGEWEDTIYSAARYLLEHGAAEDDEILTYRVVDGERQNCMRGVAGKLAKLTVMENDKTGPVIIRYSPMSDAAKEAFRKANS